MLQVWTMKLTESINICYISDRVACTIKMNIKEALMGNDGFLQMFSEVNGLQSENNRPITSQI